MNLSDCFPWTSKGVSYSACPVTCHIHRDAEGAEFTMTTNATKPVPVQLYILGVSDFVQYEVQALTPWS